MDISAPEITFDGKGVCNFCHQAQQSLKDIQAIPPLQVPKGEKYDCLIGLSGGVDSSYLLHEAVRLGLRPLCFSVDTGYNKPDADENILRLVEALKVPFFRRTIDLQQFKKLQGAFLRAGLKNVEIPTDHILMATTYEMAAQYNIKTILSGGNVATESIMPPSWGYSARDLVHMKDVYKKLTGENLTGLPTCSLYQWNWYRWIKKIKTIYLLDYVRYNRVEAEQVLIKKYGFKSTGEKHEENYFTWWFQNFYLFTKFGIDKRKAHYSSMINSGQMTRTEALERLNESPVYPELGFEKKALGYFKREHSVFKMDKNYDRIAKLVNYVSH